MSLDSWTLDYCMVCDHQTSGGPYCSQACRLSEMDSTLPASSPASPTYSLDSLCYCSSGWYTNPARRGSSSTISLNEYLRLDTSADSNSNNSDNGGKSNNQFTHSPYNKSCTSGPYIHKAESQSSLGSSQSSVSRARIPPEAMSELKYYSGLFDSVRKWKSKISYSSLS